MMYKWVMAGANRREHLSLRPLTLEEGGAVRRNRPSLSADEHSGY